MNTLRVVLAEDHAMVRQGLRLLIDSQPDMTVVGEAEDGVVAIECCRRVQPDVLVVDLSMPGLGGIAATEQARAVVKGIRVVAVTMHNDPSYLRQFFNAGGVAYVLKKEAGDTLVNVIRKACRGQSYVSPSLAKSAGPEGMAASRSAAVGGGEAFRNGGKSLTEREQEVLGLIALGNTSREIADRLHISERTVETHRAHLLDKLALHTRADLVRYAIEHGLMKEDR